MATCGTEVTPLLAPDAMAPMYRRYVGGERLHVAEADPKARSSWVFDKVDLDRPHLERP